MRRPHRLKAIFCSSENPLGWPALKFILGGAISLLGLGIEQDFGRGEIAGYSVQASGNGCLSWGDSRSDAPERNYCIIGGGYFNRDIELSRQRESLNGAIAKPQH